MGRVQIPAETVYEVLLEKKKKKIAAQSQRLKNAFLFGQIFGTESTREFFLVIPRMCTNTSRKDMNPFLLQLHLWIK